VDIECAPIRLGRAVQLATELGADYQHVDDLAACLPRSAWRSG